MIRVDIITALSRYRGDAAAISGPGSISRLLWSTDHKAASVYQMDMGYATSMALGVALARPDQRVIAVEGDGSIIAAMSVFSTIGRYQPANFFVLIIDNGVFASAGDGSVRTGSSFGTDIAAIARASGIDSGHVASVDTLESADDAIRRACSEPGPWVVVARVDDSDRSVMQGAKSRGAIPFDIIETAINFRRELASRPQQR